MELLTSQEVGCQEGYYLNRITGNVLRIVGPVDLDYASFPSTRRFERLSEDPTLPFEAALHLARQALGREASSNIINIQTVVQDNGTVVTEISDAATLGNRHRDDVP